MPTIASSAHRDRRHLPFHKPPLSILFWGVHHAYLTVSFGPSIHRKSSLKGPLLLSELASLWAFARLTTR
jgi:hypothetical protein